MYICSIICRFRRRENLISTTRGSAIDSDRKGFIFGVLSGRLNNLSPITSFASSFILIIIVQRMLVELRNHDPYSVRLQSRKGDLIVVDSYHVAVVCFEELQLRRVGSEYGG